MQIKSVSDNISDCAVSDVRDVGTKFGDPKAGGGSPEDVSNIPVYRVEADATALVSEMECTNVVTVCVSCVLPSMPIEEKKVASLMSEFGDQLTTVQDRVSWWFTGSRRPPTSCGGKHHHVGCGPPSKIGSTPGLFHRRSVLWPVRSIAGVTKKDGSVYRPLYGSFTYSAPV